MVTFAQDVAQPPEIAAPSVGRALAIAVGMLSQSYRVALSLLASLGACVAAVPQPGDDDSEASDSGGSDGAPIAAARAQDLSVFFSIPTTSGLGDETLNNKIIEMIGLAAPGSTLQMSMFKFSHRPVAKAILAASQAGVTVEIVLDKEANESTPGDATTLNPTVQDLQAGLPSGSITFCTRGNGSCQGTNIDHNKFYLFSELTDGSKHVVIQSSANLTTDLLHNNMVIDRNDPDLYAGYLDYFHDLQQKQEHLNYYRTSDGDHTIAYFFPRKDGDTIVSVLSKVHCTADSKIRVAMAFWDTGRIAIADKLVELAGKGCDVGINMRDVATGSSSKVLAEFAGVKNLTVRTYPSQHGTNIHSKYLLIDAKYDTVGQSQPVRRKLVFTGSHNYTTGALRDNDETLLRVDDAAIFDQFMANWTTIRDQIKGVARVD